MRCDYYVHTEFSDDSEYKIEVVKEELRKIGFKYHCTFDSMMPIYHEL